MGNGSSSNRGNYPAARNRVSQNGGGGGGRRPSTSTPNNNNNSSSSSRPSYRPSTTNYPNPSTSSARPGTNTYRTPTSNSNSNSNNSSSTTTISRPGAYSIAPTRSSTSGNPDAPPAVYRVTIPPHVRANQEFQVYAGNRIVRVRCPPNSRPGSTVQISVPAAVEERIEDRGDLVTPAVLTSATGQVGGGAVRMMSSVRLQNDNDINNSDNNGNGAASAPPPPMNPAAINGNSNNNNNNNNTNNRNSMNSNPSPGSNSNLPPPPPPGTAYNVVVPPNVRPGQNFPVRIHNHTLQVQCPPNARPGMTVRIIPPSIATDLTRPNTNDGRYAAPPPTAPATNPNNLSTDNNDEDDTYKQVFEVLVPQGVRPGNSFALMAAGQRVLVTCPPNARPGQRIRFTLPLSTPRPPDATDGKGKKKKSKNQRRDPPSITPQVQMKYDTQDGWIRTLRITDMKFTWIRVDSQGEMEDETTTRLDVQKLALARKIRFLKGNDDRMRTGIVTLSPAAQSSADSTIRINEDEEGKNGKEVVGYAELGFVQTQKNFEEKVEWFKMICEQKLKIPWEEGHMRITVRRTDLLEDAMNSVMSLSRTEMRKTWRIEFMGEEGIDAGGLIKEFFELVTKAIFDADSGLWLTASSDNQMCMRINPASDVSCPEDHLVYFRFLGRIMGKAMMEGQFVSGHMVQFLYKHLLGWPVTFKDLESEDEEIYNNLKQLMGYDADTIESLCLDFTTTEDCLGEKKVVELVEGGEDIEVTGDNLSEYFEAYLNHVLMNKIRLQVTELLLGFYDVMPETLLTIFDYQELELVMCGLPTIDLNDWMSNTEYSGLFSGGDLKKHNSCKWFWETVRDDFDQEMRARLLQFVTGTSGVPSRGFSVLQGADGVIKKFTIHGVSYKQAVYPRAHTCFNRIDLPAYTSKKELAEKLKFAVTSCATGFTME